MKTSRKLVLWAAAAAAGLHSGPALGWDSICYNFQDPTANTDKLTAQKAVPGSRGCEGIEAARGRWRDPEHHVDEHRQIYRLAAKMAGLPDAVLETQNIPVLTGLSSDFVLGKNGLTRTIDVRLPSAAEGAVFRSFALDELAQLPDFSFSLWDWARGNETCPLPLGGPLAEAQACHTFSSHMGATNSNHFPPQSDEWYAHYHALAMARAAECRTGRKNIWTATPAAQREATDARLALYFQACEVEALAYEAVGQHYLQDSWSAGHIWQRWGSSNLEDFPVVDADGDSAIAQQWNAIDPATRKLLLAEIIAVSAGTVHGSDPGTYEGVPMNITFHDPMCFPTDGVRAKDDGALLQFAGDLHLHDVVPTDLATAHLAGEIATHGDISMKGLPYDKSALAGQADRLIDCAVGSISAVYAELSDPSTYKDPVLGAPSSPLSSTFDPTSCRAPEATNSALNAGIDGSDVQPVLGELAAVLVDDIPGSIEVKARSDYGKARHAAIVLNATRPEGNEMSRMYLTDSVYLETGICDPAAGCTPPEEVNPAIFTMLGALPNRCYSAAGAYDCCDPSQPGPCNLHASALPDYVDPAIPAALPAPDPNALSPAWAHALMFHASRAPLLCAQVTQADLDALPALIDSAGDPTERQATCEACAEWTLPFLRVGTDAQSYDHQAEPLCHFVAPDPNAVPYVYEPSLGTADPMALARRHCGCSTLVAVTDAGLQRLVPNVTPSGVDFELLDANVPVGALPRDLAPASRNRLLVSNAQGQIMCVRDDATVDLDGEPIAGPCITFPGVTELRGIAVTRVSGKEILLAAAPGTGELIAYDLGAQKVCSRVNVAAAPGLPSGMSPYDVVIGASLGTAWVSLRRLSPTVAGAIAAVDLPKLAQCPDVPANSTDLDGDGASDVTWVAPPNPAALGSMALSPDGSKLAVGGRLAQMCSDLVKNPYYNILIPDSNEWMEVLVGCDRIFVMYTTDELFPANTFQQFDNYQSLPTRPGRFPYGLAWFQDGVRLAYSTFQGIDMPWSSTDSDWPYDLHLGPRLPRGGTLRLADTSGPTFEGGGIGGPRYWSYNMPLSGSVIGESVVVEGGSTYAPAVVYVGTLDGIVAGYGVEPYSLGSADSMWEASPTDPEGSHHTLNGNWYGGCSQPCTLNGGTCPAACPGPNGATVPGKFGRVNLGSPIRILATY